MKPSGAHTHPDSGSNVLLAASLIAVAVIAVPVLTLLAHVLELLAIIVIAFVVLGAAAGVALVVHRLRHPQASTPLRVRQVHHIPQRAPQAVQEPRPAIGAPKQELHLHFHGVDADDVAAIIARQRGD